MFRIDSDAVIDATMAGGPARYINHSCMVSVSRRKFIAVVSLVVNLVLYSYSDKLPRSYCLSRLCRWREIRRLFCAQVTNSGDINFFTDILSHSTLVLHSSTKFCRNLVYILVMLVTSVREVERLPVATWIPSSFIRRLFQVLPVYDLSYVDL